MFFPFETNKNAVVNQIIKITSAFVFSNYVIVIFSTE